MKDGAAEHRKRSDEILQQFKTIDNSLKKDSMPIEMQTEELLKNLKDSLHATGR